MDDSVAVLAEAALDRALDFGRRWGRGHLLLAAHALAARAITPVVSADLVTLREDRRGERIVDFGGEAVSRAVAALASESEAD